MDKQQHTQGPWRFRTCGSSVGNNCSIVGRKRGGWVNILQGNDNHTSETRATSEEAIANARLIAAAPDMLAALKHILLTIEADDDLIEYFQTGRVLAKDAINKATDPLYQPTPATPDTSEGVC